MIDHGEKVQLDAVALWRNHVLTGEPLDEEEVGAVVAAGITDQASWENRGGGLYWNADIHPDLED
jgi:hypothetical protein